MELMSTSFDKFYKYVYSVLDDVIPEEILGKITLAVSILLNFFFKADLKYSDLSYLLVKKKKQKQKNCLICMQYNFCCYIVSRF